MRTTIIICALALAGCDEIRRDESIATFSLPDSIGVYGQAAYSAGMGYTNCGPQRHWDQAVVKCFDREDGL